MSQDTVSAIVDEISELGTIPEVTVHILQILDDPSTSVKDLNGIMKRDPALSSRLLKLSNSAFYGFSRQITSVERAVVLLGFNAVKALAVSASMSTMFASDQSTGSFSPSRLWTHSVAVASAVKLAAQRMGSKVAEEGFMAGIMHDLGLLMENQYRPLEFARALAGYEAGEPLLEAEREAIGADHCEVARAVALRWHFPEMLVEVMGCHHQPTETKVEHQDLVRLIHVMDRMAVDLDLGFAETAGLARLSVEAYDKALQALGMQPGDAMDIQQALPGEVRAVQQVLAM